MGTYDTQLACFKAYDVRGRVPDELNEEMAELIGLAYAELVRPSRVAVGHDIRLTSEALSAALCRGLTAAGVDVVDIGLVGTEEVYFATFSLGLDGGIMVTASHNPRDYNGMKFTRDKARPISSDTGLLEMDSMVRAALRAKEAGEAASWTPRDGPRRDHRACRHPSCLPGASAYLHRRGSPQAPQGGRQPRERRRRACPRHARSPSAPDFREAERSARRFVPARGAQSPAGRKPHGHRGCGGGGGGGSGHCLGRRL